MSKKEIQHVPSRALEKAGFWPCQLNQTTIEVDQLSSRNLLSGYGRLGVRVLAGVCGQGYDLELSLLVLVQKDIQLESVALGINILFKLLAEISQ